MTTPNQTLQLGNLTLPSRFIQAPLAGYSLYPFRTLIEKYSGPHLTYTEMLPAHLLAQNNPNDPHIKRGENESFLGFQIGGNEANVIIQAIQVAMQHGADTIDLNCGCPQRKIRKKGWGSALLHCPSALFQLLKTIRPHVPVPLSIKIRLHEMPDHQKNKEILQAAIDSGCDFITIHARHWRERYESECRYDQVADLAAQCPIPLIVNGDIDSHDQVLYWQLNVPCDGYMIGRAGIGAPWLLGALDQPETVRLPSYSEIGAIFWEHCQLLTSLYGERATLLKLHGLAPYYYQHLPQADQPIDRRYFTSLAKVAQWIKQQFIT